MSFAGYREDRRGNWFGGGTKIAYTEDDYYIINEQEHHVIRVCDPKQIEVVACFYGPQFKKENIEWLINPDGGGFTYFDNVDKYTLFRAEELKSL